MEIERELKMQARLEAAYAKNERPRQQRLPTPEQPHHKGTSSSVFHAVPLHPCSTHSPIVGEVASAADLLPSFDFLHPTTKQLDNYFPKDVSPSAFSIQQQSNLCHLTTVLTTKKQVESPPKSPPKPHGVSAAETELKAKLEAAEAELKQAKRQIEAQKLSEGAAAAKAAEEATKAAREATKAAGEAAARDPSLDHSCGNPVRQQVATIGQPYKRDKEFEQGLGFMKGKWRARRSRNQCRARTAAAIVLSVQPRTRTTDTLTHTEASILSALDMTLEEHQRRVSLSAESESAFEDSAILEHHQRWLDSMPPYVRNHCDQTWEGSNASLHPPTEQSGAEPTAGPTLGDWPSPSQLLWSPPRMEWCSTTNNLVQAKPNK